MRFCTLFECKHWRKVCLVFVFVFLCCGNGMKHSKINSIRSLETVSQLALLRHHPQSIHEKAENVNQSFTSFVQDLRNQNLTAMSENFNCSAEFRHLPGVLCQNGALSKCMSVDEMLQLVPYSTKSVSEVLARLCPILLLQLHSDVCDMSHSDDSSSLRPSTTAVWGYGILFVTLISCCSLVGVLILPLLSKHVYKTVLMLFEGLAVGSLAGSSLFHLIPQTFQLIGQDAEHSYLLKSLIIFGGIYLFYISERLMKIVIDIREGKRQKKNLMFETENSIEPLKLSTENHNGTVTNPVKSEDKENLKGSLQILPNGKFIQQTNYVLPSSDSNDVNCLDEYQPRKLSHSHHHDHAVHLEKGQSTISTVAWMIIFGDGLHNFIDGLSIGAAFSESILAGISISVAVVCEEFPHELGDFAVLLSAGMTMRQALVYNFLSALTCYVGLVFGVLLGDLAEGSPYVFALAAGMFLYISLVDMMGELSEAIAEARKKGPMMQLKVLFIQNIGILLGVALLFFMAKYADQFNFEHLSSLVSSDDVIDTQLKALYSGFQEAKQLDRSVIW